MTRRHSIGMPRLLLLVGVLVTVLTVTAACGLPQSSTPVLVPKGDVPYGLLDGPSGTPAPTATPGVALTSGTIYLVDAHQRLVAVDVQVPQGPLVPLVQSLLNRLAVGPSDRERARDLATDLGPGSTITVRAVTNGTANIEWQPPNQDPSPAKLPVAVGQIVLTAASVVGVERVVFAKDGTVLPVPGPTGGNLTPDALVADSYMALLAPGQKPVHQAVPLPGSAVPATTTTGS